MVNLPEIKKSLHTLNNFINPFFFGVSYCKCFNSIILLKLAYAYDDSTSLNKCASSEHVDYTITFCPSHNSARSPSGITNSFNDETASAGMMKARTPASKGPEAIRSRHARSLSRGLFMHRHSTSHIIG